MESIKYKAIKYIRLSNADRSQGESNSIINQRLLIDDFIKKQPDIKVVGEKIDDGWSGLIFDRPAFKEMIAEVENGNINCIIVKDLSRFGREYIETGRYLRRILPAYGVRLIAINDNIDTISDSGDDLIISLKSIINDDQCRDTSKKVRSALKIKRENGDYIGSCPIYGYKRGDNIKTRNSLFIDKYPASIVNEIFCLKIDGYSAAQIAKILNDRAILSPLQYKKDNNLPHAKYGFAYSENAKWSAAAILRILNDETYAGTLIQGKTGTPNYKIKYVKIKPKEEWYILKNAHEAIIPTQKFELVQKILKLDTRTAPNNDKVNVFSGLLICGNCGNRITRKTIPYKDKKYFYFYCSTGKKGGCSLKSMLKESELYNCIFELIKSLFLNTVCLEAINLDKDICSKSAEKVDHINKQIYENEKRLTKALKLRAGLYENMINELLSKDDYKDLKEQYNTEIKTLKNAKILLNQEVKNILLIGRKFLALENSFSFFENTNSLDRKTTINLIHSIHIFSKTNIEITFNFRQITEVL